MSFEQEYMGVPVSALDLAAVARAETEGVMTKELAQQISNYRSEEAERRQMEFTLDDPSKIGTGAVKYDGGKPSVWRGVVNYFPRAVLAVAEVSTFGAKKYAWNGWEGVEEGFERYKDAQNRHALKAATGETTDPDSRLLHLAHEAWGALASLELYLRKKDGE